MLSLGGDSLFSDETVRNLLLHRCYDEHDWNHRPSCFKKGVECRAAIPKLSNEGTYIAFDTDGGVSWHQLNMGEGGVDTMCPFEVVVFRHLGDEFVNVFNKVLASLVGSNTNIQIGDFAQVYYSTLYTSKTTQKEDTASFLAVSSALDKRLARALAEGRESAEPDFVEGLSRFLTGLRAHLSSNIMSSTMAHLLVTQGSRFTFSHEFSHLLLSQLEDLLEGNEISCRFKKGGKDKEGNDTWWPDCFAHDYQWRPNEVEDLCCYELVMNYDKIYTKKNGAINFVEGHPGVEKAFLIQSKTTKIPIISMNSGIPDLDDLELESSHPSDIARYRREEYAKKALMLFLPFRRKEDLVSSGGNHWTKFISVCRNGLIWKKGLDVLQNIQNRKSSSTMKRALDHVEVLTSCKESTGGFKKKDAEFDFDVSEVEAYFEQIFQMQVEAIGDNSIERERTHKVLR